MKIKITHCRYTPKWGTLEKLIKEATNQPWGFLIGIRRKDGGCDYRAPGEYEVRFRQENTTTLVVDLTIEPV